MAVYEAIMMSVKKYHIPAMVRVDMALAREASKKIDESIRFEQIVFEKHTQKYCLFVTKIQVTKSKKNDRLVYR